ncbi:hypothetical protein ACWDDN_44820 [Streptomyces griseoruber]
METWTPGLHRDIAVHVARVVERAHPRPGDDHGPDLIAISLVHPDTPYAAAYLHGHQLGYTGKGWLRCETDQILGPRHPASHRSPTPRPGLDIPDDVGMKPAHYAVHVEARRKDNSGRILLRMGPYTQTWLVSRDAGRLNTLLAGQAATVMPGYTVTAKDTGFRVSDQASYRDLHEDDACELLAALLGDVSAS